MRNYTAHISFTACLAVVFLLSGCQLWEKRNHHGVVAELGEERLYQQDVDGLTFGLNPEDSARVVEEYIRQWATNILYYEEISKQQDDEIEKQVEEYRRSLYVYAYEQKQIAKHLDLEVSDEEINQYYQQHADQYILRQTLVRGILLTLPNKTPKFEELKKDIRHTDAAGLEKVEKYAYQYATGYELFTDTWKTGNQILLSMPFAENDLEAQLQTKDQIIMQDSIMTYLLQVTDKRMTGEAMPLEFAAESIRNILLTRRKMDFIQEERKQLYEKNKNKITIYDQEK